MRLGDKIIFTPAGFEGELTGAVPRAKPKPRQVVGTVVYLHPQGRYFTLAAQVNGATIRESFQQKRTGGKL